MSLGSQDLWFFNGQISLRDNLLDLDLVERTGYVSVDQFRDLLLTFKGIRGRKNLFDLRFNGYRNDWIIRTTRKALSL